MSYIAYHMHWGLDVVLDLEHGDRIRILREVASLNERAWEGLTNV
ncbi:hypothetical protein acdb102_22560 [Acidothermaceae bacterium B102]|nr:hypothetical protein acdb102_22560 [Acidothermaceae bacterium B102]